MDETPPHHARNRSLLVHRWPRWLLFFALFTSFAVTSVPVEATSAGKSTRKKKKAKPRKRPATRGLHKSAPVKPLGREVSGPLAVPTGDGEGEGDLAEAGGDAGEAVSSPESELDAIEREVRAQPVEVEEARLPEPPEPEVPTEPKLVKHALLPGETLEEVAERYEVEVAELARWNALKVDAPIPRKKKELKVHTLVTPPPREKFSHLVKRGDTWAKVAAAMEVELAQLRKWNPRLGKKLDYKKKQRVVAWRELDLSANAELATKLAQIRVRAGGLSIGKPNRGRLVRGVPLPERPDLYVKAKPDQAYGSTHTVMQVLAAFTRFRHETGFTGQIAIRGMSRAQGGRFRPHKSHQSGRDVDIRLPLLARAESKKRTTSADVDWKAAWKLMHAFLETGEVEYIFLEYALQRNIYKAARQAGVPAEQLKQWIEWPVRIKGRTNKRVIVRHVAGHTTHMHVRVRCAPNEKHCVASR